MREPSFHKPLRLGGACPFARVPREVPGGEKGRPRTRCDGLMQVGDPCKLVFKNNQLSVHLLSRRHEIGASSARKPSSGLDLQVDGTLKCAKKKTSLQSSRDMRS